MLTAESRKQHASDLEFLRDRHFSSIGSSLDRSATEAFCSQHNATFAKESHGDSHCHFADLNFTFSTYVTFGMHQSDWYTGYDFPENGKLFEDRINRKYTELVEAYGQPTLLLFTSALWGAYTYSRHD